MNTLGVYFGPKSIGLTLTKGKKFINHIEIPLSDVTSSDLEDKVPAEIKIVALLNEALRMNKIEAKEAALSLSGKDLIVRTFEIPNLPNEEIAGAINFEAKKYIPFKIEELISDCQVEFDKASRINTVLFVGIKKEVLDKYCSIFSQLNIKITSLGYSGFSIANSLKAEGIKESGVMGILCSGISSGDETNFIVYENGFPLFSRDISLSLKGVGPAEYLDKLKVEVRVSLDYYQRKFPGKGISKFVVFSGYEEYQDLQMFLSELGYVSKQFDFTKLTGKSLPYSSVIVKSYGVSVTKVTLAKVKTNLIQVKTRGIKPVSAWLKLDLKSSFRGINIDYRLVIGGALVCLFVFGYGLYRSEPFREELNKVIISRVKVDKVDDKLSTVKLQGISAGYKRKLEKLDSLVKKQLYLTEVLDSIPRSIPDGVWLTKFHLDEDRKVAGRIILTMEGISYLKNSDNEFQAVNKFFENLKGNLAFSQYFSEINISSISQKPLDKITATAFTLICKNYKEGK